MDESTEKRRLIYVAEPCHRGFLICQISTTRAEIVKQWAQEDLTAEEVAAYPIKVVTDNQELVELVHGLQLVCNVDLLGKLMWQLADSTNWQSLP